MNTFLLTVQGLLTRLQVRRMRLLIQSAFGVFCLYAGFRFYQFYLWAIGASPTYVSRPPSVEGFLPISALLGLKQLLYTGQYDFIHPAGLTILLTAIVIGLFFRKGFCGWICPIGYTSNLAEKTGRRFKILYRLPVWLDYPLLSLKYILLAFFLYIIFWKMNLNQIEAFQRSPYNMAADAKMLHFFLEPSRLAGGIMLFLLLISFIVRNFWCRYLCPYGAFLGLLALASPFQIKRNEKNCIDCRKCEQTCPASIRIARHKSMRNGECIGCMECVEVCPQKECLTLAGPKGKNVNLFILPTVVVATYLLFWLIAVATGHWETKVPVEMLQKFYTISAKLAHPDI